MSEDAAFARLLAGHRVLLCHGLFGEVMTGLRIDYMRGQLAWLRSLGVDAAPVRLPTAAPVAANAQRIAAAVLAAPAPTLLVAHSKGGLEALAALLDPVVAVRCRGLLALQCPFHGSPVADLALGFGPMRAMADKALRLAKLGEGQGLLDLTCAPRDAWMRDNHERILALMRGLPVASLATRIGAAPDWRDRAYLPLARWMERQGAGENDGLVPVASTQLPGARHEVTEGGHRALVAAGPGRDPIGLLRRELSALLMV